VTGGSCGAGVVSGHQTIGEEQQAEHTAALVVSRRAWRVLGGRAGRRVSIPRL